MVVVLIILLTLYSLRRLWVVWAEILNFDGVGGQPGNPDISIPGRRSDGKLARSSIEMTITLSDK